MHAFPDTSWSDRSKAPMPADRAAQQPWLIAGRLLFAPFAPRDAGLTARETEAIEAMAIRLQHDRRAGLLPNSTAFWFSPIDGRTTPLTANQAWLRLKVLQHVVVDMKLLQALGRVIPMTLLPQPTEPGYGARAVRRAAPAVIPPGYTLPRATPPAGCVETVSVSFSRPLALRGEGQVYLKNPGNRRHRQPLSHTKG
jgi:hypothetical protein